MNIVELQSKIDSLVRRNMTFYKRRKTFHEAMQKDLSDMASDYGFKGKNEYRVSKGYIDVAWLDVNNKLLLAIEVDSSVKSKSVEKLSMLDKEVEKIWLCYSPTEINVTDYENLIGGLVMKYNIRFSRV